MHWGEATHEFLEQIPDPSSLFRTLSFDLSFASSSMRSCDGSRGRRPTLQERSCYGATVAGGIGARDDGQPAKRKLHGGSQVH